jgi:hypothetical protein
MFVPLGIPILCLDTVADLFYFWVNNFRGIDTLKVTIIPKDPTTISHQSVKSVISTVKKFGHNAIKTVNSKILIKVFNKHLNVMPNIQFLMFGQMVPAGGFNDTTIHGHTYTLKSMKTHELQEQRLIEKKKLDDTVQTGTS